MSKNVITQVILILIFTFTFSSLIMPIMKKIANHINAIDVPKDKRRVHTKPIPKLGGVGIFISFLFGYMIFGTPSTQMNAILIGGFILIITAIIDDIKPLTSFQQFVAHLCAALIITVYGRLLLNEITAFGFYIQFGWEAYPITIFFIIACINIINLIDGLDGLSGGITSIFYLTVGIICIVQGRTGSLEFLITFIMLGSTLGFLKHNFHPATIFAGDSTMFMGYIIAVISLLGFKGTVFISVFIPLLILTIPILDTSFAILRRLINKQPLFKGDKRHIHHQLLNLNIGYRKTVLLIYLINILFSIATIFYTIGNTKIGIVIYVILFVALIWFVTTTSILFDTDKIKKIKEKFKKNTFKK